MKTTKGAATIEYAADGTVVARLEQHGTFSATAEGFRFNAGRRKAELVAAVAAAYSYNPLYRAKAYWAQYPIDILRVVAADLVPVLELSRRVFGDLTRLLGEPPQPCGTTDGIES